MNAPSDPAVLASAKRSKAARLAHHIETLCAFYEIELIDHLTGTRARAWRKPRRIQVPPVRGVTSYYVALHEIGHIVGRGRSGRRLEQEVAAWRWALETAIVPPTPGVRRGIFRRLWSYVEWARNRQYRSHGRPFIPASNHPLWSLLEATATSTEEIERVRDFARLGHQLTR